jgi:hypothetical protein
VNRSRSTSRHRRECRDADSQPHPSFPRKRESSAAGLKPLALDPRFRGGDERSTSSRAFRGRRHPLRSRPPDDLRRPCSLPGGELCAPADLQPRGSGLRSPRRTGAFIAERTTAAGVPPTAPQGRPPGDSPQHQRRRPLVHAFRDVRNVRSVRQMRAPAQIPHRQEGATVKRECSQAGNRARAKGRH